MSSRRVYVVVYRPPCLLSTALYPRGSGEAGRSYGEWEGDDGPLPSLTVAPDQ